MEVGKGRASAVVKHQGEIILLESSVRFCGTASAGGACTAFALEMPEDADRNDLPGPGEEVELSLVWACGKEAELTAKITEKVGELVYFSVVKLEPQENPNQRIIDDIMEVVGEPEEINFAPEAEEHTAECEGHCEEPIDVECEEVEPVELD